MKLLDLKYILVKSSDGEVKGFTSLMPTYEDDLPVLYCYEIHLEDELQGYVICLGVSHFLTCMLNGVEMWGFGADEGGVGRDWARC